MRGRNRIDGVPKSLALFVQGNLSDVQLAGRLLQRFGGRGSLLCFGFDQHGQCRRVCRQRCHEFSVGRFPQPDFAQPVAGHHPGTVVGEGNPQGDVAQRVEGTHLTAIGIPNLGDAVASDRCQPSVGCKANGGSSAGVGSPALYLGAVFHFPKLDRAVFTGGGQQIRIQPPGDVGDRPFVSLQILIFAARVGFPNEHTGAAIGSGQQHAVGAELQRVDPIGVLANFLNDGSRRRSRRRGRLFRGHPARCGCGLD